MRTTLEQIAQQKLRDDATVDKSQAALDELNARQPVLSNDLASAKAKQAKTNDRLLKAAGKLGRDQVAHTSDGNEIMVVDGVVRVLKPVEAASVTVDDDEPDPAAPSSPAPAAPVPGPETPAEPAAVPDVVAPDPALPTAGGPFPQPA